MYNKMVVQEESDQLANKYIICTKHKTDERLDPFKL